MPKKRMALNGGKNMEKPIETWWFTKFINLNHQTWRYIDSRFRHHYTFWILLAWFIHLPTITNLPDHSGPMHPCDEKKWLAT
jgi:hypothetical protein